MDRTQPQLEFNAHSLHRCDRRLWLCCILLVCMGLGLTGCSNRINFVRQDRTPSEPVLKFGMTDTEIFTHLNQTPQHVYAWRSSSCDITVKHGPVPITVDANIACESPRKFRLLATSFRGPEVDLGSNDEEFWFWSNQPDNNAIFMASHENLEQAQKKLQIPFHPDWVMEVMGVIPLEQEKYKIKWKEDLKELYLITRSFDGQGQPVFRRIVIDSLTGRITGHEMYGNQRQPIAFARLSNYKSVGPAGVELPHQLVMEWPQQGARFRMKFKDIDINPSDAQSSVAQWQMPQNSRHPIVNIGLNQ